MMDRDLVVRAAAHGLARINTGALAKRCDVSQWAVRVSLGAQPGRVSDDTRRKVLRAVGLTDEEINARQAVAA